MQGRVTGKLLIGTALLVLVVGLVASACGGDGIESDELSSVVQQSVAAAVAAAVPEATAGGASAAEISALVQQAVEAAAPEGVTAAEIGTLVEAAVAAASEPTVSAAKIGALITQAVEQAAADAATPLSASDIESIVAAAIAAIPEPEVVFAQPRGTVHLVHERIWAGMEILDAMSTTYFIPTVELLQDRLVRLDLEGVPTPMLATSWEVSPTADRYTFSLRLGVTFADGSPMTSQDVLYTMQRAVTEEISGQLAETLSFLDPMGFETPDDHTIVFNLNQAHVDLPLLLRDFSIRVIPDGSGDTIAITGMGTGPFSLDELDVDGVTRVSARDDYWDGVPGADAMTIVGIADADARVQALLAGQIHMIEHLTIGQAQLFEGDSNFQIQESPTGTVLGIAMIVTEPPFDDPLVRQALKLVVDPEEMIAIVMQGHGTAACNTPVWPVDQYYLAQDCSQDIEQARALLAEAGYPDGLTVEFAFSDTMSGWTQMATVYQQQAAEAGITIELNQVPAEAFWSEVWMIHPFATTGWWMQPAGPMLNTAFRCGSSWNETFWCSEEFDQLMDAAQMEVDFETRRELYRAAQQIQSDDSGMIAPFFINEIRALDSSLQGLAPQTMTLDFPWHQFMIVEP